MNAGGRLGAFAAGLVVLFGGSYAAAAALVDDETAADRAGTAPQHGGHAEGAGDDAHEGHGAHDGSGSTTGGDGLAVAQAGYRLADVSAPTAVGEQGELRLQVLDPAGTPVTAYDTVHDEELHLVVVRTDGAHFRHVHPTRDAGGTWTIPWSWDAAGTYRVYADTRPTDGEALVLGTTLDVAGELDPVDPAPTRDAVVDGYEVYLGGNLLAGGTSELTAEVRRDGEPVTTLEPYLGAFGHLVALRADDLAYLHVHPTTDEPEVGASSGPEIAFEAHVSTVGRYLLYLDFQVEGEVRTAAFVVDAVPLDGGGAHDRNGDHDHGGQDEDEEGDGHDHEH